MDEDFCSSTLGAALIIQSLREQLRYAAEEIGRLRKELTQQTSQSVLDDLPPKFRKPEPPKWIDMATPLVSSGIMTRELAPNLHAMSISLYIDDKVSLTQQFPEQTTKIYRQQLMDELWAEMVRRKLFKEHKRECKDTHMTIRTMTVLVESN